ncbi:acyl dehydratase [Marmoricola sp. OAE513]|uniref:MaoC/PaaZ C-terminal domain-containing protein n=1 Tax=Marmoricola sp. OAE513 TaxID=2817894 RepID=UPI001AE3F88F
MAATGTTLPAWELPLTPTLIVSTAIATRDFQDVHHDRDLAQGHGSKDIFMNILTTTGYVQKYVGDWAREAVGPNFRITSCGLRLGAPAYPYDTLAFSGTVVDNADDAPAGTVTIDVVGVVSLGNHVNAKVTLVVNEQSGAAQ